MGLAIRESRLHLGLIGLAILESRLHFGWMGLGILESRLHLGWMGLAILESRLHLGLILNIWVSLEPETGFLTITFATSPKLSPETRFLNLLEGNQKGNPALDKLSGFHGRGDSPAFPTPASRKMSRM
jgi:hypothetical protein